MFTPQKKNKQGLKQKQILISLSPGKYVEHEQAVKFLEKVPNGMGVHTIVQALNELEDKQKAENVSDDTLLKNIAQAEENLKKVKAAIVNNNARA